MQFLPLPACLKDKTGTTPQESGTRPGFAMRTTQAFLGLFTLNSFSLSLGPL